MQTNSSKKRGFWWKIPLVLLAVCMLVVFSLFIYLNSLLNKSMHPHATPTLPKVTVNRLDDSTTFIGPNYLRRIRPGMYVMYVEGDAPTRGNVMGALTKELHAEQEKAFITQIQKMIPNANFLKLLKYFVAYFNRDIEKYIPREYLDEIYAESTHMSSQYDDLIGSPYMRMLQYHAAHDIGHALQDKNFVAGCTSFAAWNEYSADSALIVGRNFDFYVGDDFARNKILACIQPDSGYTFAMVTWPGMIGVVSGINVQGLTVTINAAKSTVPTRARTPISILARQILQYAATLEDAQAIAANASLFVSESILVSSGKENKAIVIEKSPDNMGVFAPDSSIIICPNHFQSDAFRMDSANLRNIRQSSSAYRYDRLAELIQENASITPVKAVKILRNPYGLNGTSIGWGNEKAINQLIAHHAVVFQPATLDFWVSTAPYQMGEFLHFNVLALTKSASEIATDDRNIPADEKMIQEIYRPYAAYKEVRSFVWESIREARAEHLVQDSVLKLTKLNPDYYEGYEIAGDYYISMGRCPEGIAWYEEAMARVFPTLQDRERIILKLSQNKARGNKCN